jgi:glyoxylase I family protein
MSNAETKNASAQSPSSGGAREQATAAAVVRYQVKDIDRSIAFYTGQLGFRLQQKAGSMFAAVTRGGLRLILSGPGSSGARPMPDGQLQQPGGWNRIVLDVDDLASQIQTLETAGIRFRNEVEVGPGGKQIQIEDPDGNPIELHEPPSGAE